MMKIVMHQKENSRVAVVTAKEILLKDLDSALDLMARIQYEYQCNKFILEKSAIVPEFFDLSTTLAGQILQKYVNYHTKLAVVGDFSKVQSKSLRDFIYECNRGTDFFFLPDTDTAIARLHAVCVGLL